MSSQAMAMTGSQSQIADSHSVDAHRPTVGRNALLTRLLLMTVFSISTVSGPAQDAAGRSNGKTEPPEGIVAGSSRIQLELRVITGDDKALSELLPPADGTGLPAMDEMQSRAAEKVSCGASKCCRTTILADGRDDFGRYGECHREAFIH